MTAALHTIIGQAREHQLDGRGPDNLKGGKIRRPGRGNVRRRTAGNRSEVEGFN